MIVRTTIFSPVARNLEVFSRGDLRRKWLLAIQQLVLQKTLFYCGFYDSSIAYTEFVFRKTTSKFRAWRSMHVCFRKHFAQRRLLIYVRKLL